MERLADAYRRVLTTGSEPPHLAACPLCDPALLDSRSQGGWCRFHTPPASFRDNGSWHRGRPWLCRGGPQGRGPTRSSPLGGLGWSTASNPGGVPWMDGPFTRVPRRPSSMRFTGEWRVVGGTILLPASTSASQSVQWRPCSLSLSALRRGTVLEVVGSRPRESPPPPQVCPPVVSARRGG